jgi:hypothetical protein
VAFASREELMEVLALGDVELDVEEFCCAWAANVNPAPASMTIETNASKVLIPNIGRI